MLQLDHGRHPVVLLGVVVGQVMAFEMRDGRVLAQGKKVWLLTQFYTVDFSQSRIGVKKCVFKVCVSCFWRYPGTSAPSAAHLTVALYLCSSGSNARGESRALNGRAVLTQKAL